MRIQIRTSDRHARDEMSSIEKIVKFNAQTSGREKLIRLCLYTTKFVKSILHLYYAKYAKGGIQLLEFLYKLKELEQYFLSCRRLISFGRCTDQLYLALKSMQYSDPVVRMTLAASKFWMSIQMLADHVLWLNQMGLMQGIEKQIWIERANKFWLYSVSSNLLRDFYELICVVQKHRNRERGPQEEYSNNFKFSTPIRWTKDNPKLSCDIVKNVCDFWIPYTAVNKITVHPSIIAMLGIISTSMGIIQLYSREYRLSPC